ncbi:BspA family leucine-rich repeat surface protein [Mesoplasma florum]|uniref:BspA family leucine-rich repeat surface protein n=1 Tax=Mesoplasma florum TaxID=2151 RepID=UPI0018E06D78|nr:BspA family leucine-rich repeat surface protein [Mesoplasma florum]
MKNLLALLSIGFLTTTTVSINIKTVNIENQKIKIDSILLEETLNNSVNKEMTDSEIIETLEKIEKPLGVLKINASKSPNFNKVFIVNITIDEENYYIDKNVIKINIEELIQNDIVAKSSVQSALDSAVTSKITEQEAIAKLKAVNVPGVVIKDVTVSTTRGFAEKIFNVSTTLSENYSWDVNNFDGNFIIKASNIGQNDIVAKSSVQSALDSAVTSKITEQEAIAKLKAVNVPGVVIKDVTVSTTRGFAEKIFTVSTTLSENYSWDVINFDGNFIVKASSIGDKEIIDIEPISLEIKKLENKQYLNENDFNKEIEEIFKESDLTDKVGYSITKKELFTYVYGSFEYIVSFSNKNPEEIDLINSENITVKIRIGTKETVDLSAIKNEISSRWQHQIGNEFKTLDEFQSSVEKYFYSLIDDNSFNLSQFKNNIKVEIQPIESNNYIFEEPTNYLLKFVGDDEIILINSEPLTLENIKIGDYTIIDSKELEETFRKTIEGSKSAKDASDDIKGLKIEGITRIQSSINYINQTAEKTSAKIYVNIAIDNNNYKIDKYYFEFQRDDFNSNDKYVEGETYYVEYNSNLKKSIAGSAPAKTKEIIEFGWDKEGKIYSCPQSIIKVPNYLNKGIRNLKNLFYNATSFNQDISNWDTSNIIDMSEMFSGASAFNQDISKWVTSNVTDMSRMFSWASAFNYALKTNNEIWDTSKVKDMSGMFENAASFNSKIIFSDTSNVINMSRMFYRATSFNSEIILKNSEKVRSTSYMFFECTNFNQKLELKSSNLQDASSMFFNAFEFNSPLIFSNTSNITDISCMFFNSIFNQDISNWDVSNVTIMYNFLTSNPNFNQDISKWNTQNVENMFACFAGATSFNQDISNWDVSKVTNMSYMFYNATSFNQDISNWDVSNVNDMSEMFYNATSFNQDISNWDVSKVTNMSYMFYNATSFNQDISNWDVSKVTSSSCFDLNTSTNWTIERKPKFIH